MNRAERSRQTDKAQVEPMRKYLPANRQARLPAMAGAALSRKVWLENFGMEQPRAGHLPLVTEFRLANELQEEKKRQTKK